MKRATYLRVLNSNGYIYNIIPTTREGSGNITEMEAERL